MNLVNELQISAEQDDVLIVLRKAKRLASKLGVTDIDHWLRCEQEGYDEGDEIPGYRTVKGTLVFNTNGPIPVGLGMVGNGILDYPGSLTVDRRLGDTMGELLAMVTESSDRNHGLYLLLEGADADLRRTLHPMIANRVTFMLRLNPGQIRAIPEAVKDRILNWSCELERRGVLGENMTFNDLEKQKANAITFNLQNCNIEQLNNMGKNVRRQVND